MPVSYYAEWPFFFIVLVIWCVVSLPVFKAADSPPISEKSRIETLDGLRGFLALAVFFQHGAIYHQYLVSGRWELPPSRFYTMLGQVGVAIFFMITGYLFWTQMLRSQGKPNYAKLYMGRLFRIIPLYWFAITFVFIGAIIHTGMHLREPPLIFIKELIKWLFGGYFPEVPINGYQRTSNLIAGVTWTLHYEWIFYASLFIIGRLALSRRIGIAAPILGLAVVAIWVVFVAKPTVTASPPVCLMLFVIGMAAASALSAFPKIRLPQWIGSTVVCALICATFLSFGNANTAIPIILLGCAFYLISTDFNLFGLLIRRPSKRLGDISYGIYLLQGPVLAASFSAPSIRRLALSSPLAHWSIIGSDAIILVCLATTTHALIERPGVDLGRYLWTRLTAGSQLSNASQTPLTR